MAYCKVLSRHLRTGTEEKQETIFRNNRCLARDWKLICFDLGQKHYSPTDFVFDLRERKQQEFGKSLHTVELHNLYFS